MKSCKQTHALLARNGKRERVIFEGVVFYENLFHTSETGLAAPHLASSWVVVAGAWQQQAVMVTQANRGAKLCVRRDLLHPMLLARGSSASAL